MKQLTNIFILALLLFLFACSPKQESQIEGRWKPLGAGTPQDEKFEVFPDGTLRIIGGGRTVSGKYLFLKDGRLKVSFDGRSEMSILEVSFSGDMMTTVEENGAKSNFRRIRGNEAVAIFNQTDQTTHIVQKGKNKYIGEWRSIQNTGRISDYRISIKDNGENLLIDISHPAERAFRTFGTLESGVLKSQTSPMSIDNATGHLHWIGYGAFRKD